MGSLFFVFLFISGSLFLYLVWSGKLQAVQEVVLNPNFDATIYNDYNNTFNNEIDNNYQNYNNHTIIINNFIVGNNN